MAISSLLAALEASPPAIYFRESAYGFPIAESAHVIAIVLVLGSIAVVDLRLLNLASRNATITRMSKDILPWTWGFFILAAFTGMMMFITKPEQYLDNIPFRLKFLCIALAGINMLVFEFLTMRQVAKWDHGVRPPSAVAIAGALSLFFWSLVVVFGRWIGFTV